MEAAGVDMVGDSGQNAGLGPVHPKASRPTRPGNRSRARANFTVIPRITIDGSSVSLKRPGLVR
jgi:hypothetical protein